MRLLEQIRLHPWIAAASAGVLAGVIVGLFLPIRAASPQKSEEAQWTLPTPAEIKRFDEARYQAVRNARFWGELKTPGARNAPVATWNLGAIVTRPALRIAVTVGGKPGVTWFRPGDALPDGANFVGANRDTVWYEKDGCRRARKLYHKPAAETESCIGAGPAAPRIVAPAAPSARTP